MAAGWLRLTKNITFSLTVVMPSFFWNVLIPTTLSFFLHIIYISIYLIRIISSLTVSAVFPSKVHTTDHSLQAYSPSQETWGRSMTIPVGFCLTSLGRAMVRKADTVP